jgi:hypothetical protein
LNIKLLALTPAGTIQDCEAPVAEKVIAATVGLELGTDDDGLFVVGEAVGCGVVGTVVVGFDVVGLAVGMIASV